MLYIVIQYSKHPKIRRYSDLVVVEEAIFSCKIEFISWLVSLFYKNSVIEHNTDTMDVIHFGDELKEDFCKIYGIKEPHEAWRKVKKTYEK